MPKIFPLNDTQNTALSIAFWGSLQKGKQGNKLKLRKSTKNPWQDIWLIFLCYSLFIVFMQNASALQIQKSQSNNKGCKKSHQGFSFYVTGLWNIFPQHTKQNLSYQVNPIAVEIIINTYIIQKNDCAH